MTMTIKDLSCGKPTWCPGCGHFAVLNALQRAIIDMDLTREEVACVTGIGCSSKLSEYIDVYGFHTIHGRSLPIAQGVKLANPKLTVIAAGGDGDGTAIGCGHFVHAARRNIDITYIMMNNQVYSLTKGQTSPTSDRGFVTKTSPDGAEEAPINVMHLALTAGATFVATGFSSDVMGLSRIIAAGIAHKGFSFINVISPCVTFNKLNTYEQYKNQVYNVEELPGYDPLSYEKAINIALEYFVRKPLGIIYKMETSTFRDAFISAHPIPPARQDISNFENIVGMSRQYSKN